MNRFARERHEYRAFATDGDRVITKMAKGPWRIKKEQAMEDAANDFPHFEHVVVQKVRIGLPKILETTVVR